MHRFFYIIIILLLFLLGTTFISFYHVIHPNKVVSALTPDDFNINYEKVSFCTEDKYLIKGWFIKNPKSGAKTIILLHGYPFDKGDILPTTLFLHNEYNLLYFDFRSLGESEGTYTTIGKEEVQDLGAAIDYLKSKGINEVGVWGFSLGGAVALMAAPTMPQIKAIIAESSYARLDWMAYDYYHTPLLKYLLGELLRFWAYVWVGFDVKEVSPAHAAKSLQIPVLIIHARQDQRVSFENALLLRESLNNNLNAEFIFLSGQEHGKKTINYKKIVSDFFLRALK